MAKSKTLASILTAATLTTTNLASAQEKQKYDSVLQGFSTNYHPNGTADLCVFAESPLYKDENKHIDILSCVYNTDGKKVLQAESLLKAIYNRHPEDQPKVHLELGKLPVELENQRQVNQRQVYPLLSLELKGSTFDFTLTKENI